MLDGKAIMSFFPSSVSTEMLSALPETDFIPLIQHYIPAVTSIMRTAACFVRTAWTHLKGVTSTLSMQS